jgi:hypothetical protein
MTTEIQKEPSFEEKMKARIKDSIGDLLSDEDIKKLIDKGLQDVFFTKPRIKDPRDSYKMIDGPTMLEDIIKTCIQPAVEKVVREYVAEHQEEVFTNVQAVVSQGLGTAMFRSIDSMFSSQLLNMQSSIQNQLQNMQARQY